MPEPVEVTDPALLAQLNGTVAPTRKQPAEVTDPVLLARLTAGAPARESSWGDYVGPALVRLIGTGSAIAAARHGRLPRNPAPTTQQFEQAAKATTFSFIRAGSASRAAGGQAHGRPVNGYR
jgi:hypothetical protein